MRFEPRFSRKGAAGGRSKPGLELLLSSFVFNLNLLTVGGSLVNSICFGLSGFIALDRR